MAAAAASLTTWILPNPSANSPAIATSAPPRQLLLQRQRHGGLVSCSNNDGSLRHHLLHVRRATAVGPEVELAEPDAPPSPLPPAAAAAAAEGGVAAGKEEEGEVAQPQPQPQPQARRNVRRSNGGRRVTTLKAEELKEGAVFPGTVRTVVSYGAFVDIGAFTDGLVHISQLSDSYVAQVQELVSVGQQVNVRILEVDFPAGRISLSMRPLPSAEPPAPPSSPAAPPPTAAPKAGWERRKIAGRGASSAPSKTSSAKPNVSKGQMVTGVVKNLTKTGAFLTLAGGDEAFLRAADALNPTNASLESLLEVGKELSVRVQRIDGRGKVVVTQKQEVDMKRLNLSINNNEEAGAVNPFELAFRQNNFFRDSEADEAVPQVEAFAEESEELVEEEDPVPVTEPVAEEVLSESGVAEVVEATLAAVTEERQMPVPVLAESEAEEVALLEVPEPIGTEVVEAACIPVVEEQEMPAAALPLESVVEEVVKMEVPVADEVQTPIQEESLEESLLAVALQAEEVPCVPESLGVQEVVVEVDSAVAVEEEAPGVPESSEEQEVVAEIGSAVGEEEVTESIEVEKVAKTEAAVEEVSTVPESSAVEAVVEIEAVVEEEELPCVPETSEVQEVVAETGSAVVEEEVSSVPESSDDVEAVVEIEAVVEEEELPCVPEISEVREVVAEAGSAVVEEEVSSVPASSDVDAVAEIEAVVEGEAVPCVSETSEVQEVVAEAGSAVVEEEVSSVPESSDVDAVAEIEAVVEGEAVPRVSEVQEVVAETGSAVVEEEVAESSAVEKVAATEAVVESAVSESSEEVQEVVAEIELVVVGEEASEEGREVVQAGAGVEQAKSVAESSVVESISEQEVVNVGEAVLVEEQQAAVKVAGAAAGLIGSYIHDGRIGVLIEVKSETEAVARADVLKAAVQDLAMQVAACPQVQYVSVEDVPVDIVEREREVEGGKEDLASKPEAIRSKIVEGRVNKILKELCLLEQPYIRNDKLLVRDFVKEVRGALGQNVEVRRFKRFVLGEGIEKRSTDLVADIAAVVASAKPKQEEVAAAALGGPAAGVAVSALAVKELRQATGAGMMDCKKALSACGGDVEKASEYLRKKGLASAEKKGMRVAAEGAIGRYIHEGRVGVLMEVNCETDFVARGELFKALVQDLAKQLVASPEVEYVSLADVPAEVVAVAREKAVEEVKESEDLQGWPEGRVPDAVLEGKVAKRLEALVLLEQPLLHNDKLLVKDHIKQSIAAVGENIQVRRFVKYVVGGK